MISRSEGQCGRCPERARLNDELEARAEHERDQARAEVERLRADAEVRDFREGGLKQAVDVLTADRHCRHLLQQQAETRLAAANALLDSVIVEVARTLTPELRERIDAHLAAQPATAPTEVVDCESCSNRGRDCDNGDHCDNCGNRMDGDIAATADVCHDCWITAKTRTEAEQRVLDAAGAIHPRALKRPLQYVDDWAEFVDAELARRGLKR